MDHSLLVKNPRDSQEQECGMVLMVGGSTVKTTSRKQGVVYQNPYQCELVAVYFHVDIALDIYDFLTELGLQPSIPILYQDKQSCIATYTNLHNDIKEDWFRRHFTKNKALFIRQLIDLGHLKVKFIPTEDQPADRLTKSMGGAKFFKFRSIIFDHRNLHPFEGDVLWYATYRADYNPLVKKSDLTLQRNDDSDDSTEVTNQTAEVTTNDNHYYSID